MKAMVANAPWGVVKRARKGDLERHLNINIMDVLAKSGGLYGVDLSEWERWEEMEMAQGKFVKMSTGLDRNTPDYIWKMEAERIV